jgi:hypothetical protein
MELEESVTLHHAADVSVGLLGVLLILLR